MNEFRVGISIRCVSGVCVSGVCVLCVCVYILFSSIPTMLLNWYEVIERS